MASEVRVKLRGLDQARAALHPDLFERSERRTTNEMVRKSRTLISKTIRVRYTVKAAELKKRLSVKVKRSATGTAKITARGKRFSLVHFGARQIKAGVSVSIRRGNRKRIEHAFLARMKSGHEGAWWREKKGGKRVGRLPIDEITTLSAPDMMDQDDVYAEVQGLLDREYDATFRRNYAFYAAK